MYRSNLLKIISNLDKKLPWIIQDNFLSFNTDSENIEKLKKQFKHHKTEFYHIVPVDLVQKIEEKISKKRHKCEF